MTTLADIRLKARRLTGRPSPQQITDEQIDEYVNTFYLYDMPEEIRIFTLKDTFSFVTEANIDTYDMATMPVTINGITDNAADVYYNLEPPAYVAGYQSFYTQSREQFFRVYPMLAQIVQTIIGDGTVGPYAFTFPNVPILQRSITVGAVDTLNVLEDVFDVPTDRETGTWQIANDDTAVLAGSINYLTGVGTVTFNNNIDSGDEITVSAVPYAANRPQAVMYYQNKLTLRPVPDASYKVELNAYRTPTSLIAAGDNPELKAWWQLLSYGAAKKIFEDAQDPEGLNVLLPGLQEQLDLVLRRSLVQQSVERTATIYTEMTGYPYSNFNQRF